jgi:acyl-CoA hydrolase/GNAT superfamily N-acetyltransferase
MPSEPAIDWQARFSERVSTAEEAVSLIRPGQRVFLGSGAAVPQELLDPLVRRQDLYDITIEHILTLAGAPYTDLEAADRFRHNAFFIGPNVREAVNTGRADYTPIFLHQVPGLMRQPGRRFDAALISVSPPDKHGFCTYGVSCDVSKAASESARLVIAEVNQCMPRVLGDNHLHVTAIDRLVPSNRALLEAQQGHPDETSRQIASHVCELIEDGCTMQLGIGGIPDAILHNLHHFRDLGVHTEMLSDGIVPLVERGVITNARKTLLMGKLVCSFVLGTRRLYDFVNDNISVECRPSDFTNDPFTIARNDKMVAVNGAIEVDLTGQVVSDSIGTTFFSGFGGQVDFIRGAARSRGGRPIITLPATAKGGTVSRIVPQLRPGAGVVTSRADVHFVVTEFGVANLHGLNVRQRALALIEIADPRFREELLQAAIERDLIQAEHVAIRATVSNAFERMHMTLGDDQQIVVRRLRLDDEDALKDLYHALPQGAWPSGESKDFQRQNFEADLALTAQQAQSEDRDLVAVASFKQRRDVRVADAGVYVRRDQQQRGIGSALLMTLIEQAQAIGITVFEAKVTRRTAPLVHMMSQAGFQVTTIASGDVTTLRIPLERKLGAVEA